MKYSVEGVFQRILDREMAVLISEKEKMCQSGAVIDLATDRIVEAYFLKSEYANMTESRDFERNVKNMEKTERERYQELLRKEREA